MLARARVQESTQFFEHKFGPFPSFADRSGRARAQSTLGFVEIGTIGVNILCGVASGIWPSHGKVGRAWSWSGTFESGAQPVEQTELCRNHFHNPSIFPCGI